MKRAIGLILATAACIVAFLSVRGTLPFIPIFGHSMEPTLHSGGLLMISPVDPKTIQVGDIIVYNIPSAVRSYYNYPPTIAHRVIKVLTVPTLGFRTQGDNTGEDPFTIRPEDVRGTVGRQIPYLGLPLLFFQSKQGIIFAAIAIGLLALFLYGSEIARGGGWVHKGIFSPVINEEKRANRMLSRKIESTERKMDSTEQALEKFSAAVAEYAKHLASHTSAIQGLSEASHELKKGAAEQNRVLSAIMDNVVKNVPTQAKSQEVCIEPETVKKGKAAPRYVIPEAAARKRETPKAKPEPVKIELESKIKIEPEAVAKVEPEVKAKNYHKALDKGVTPGCARKHPVSADETPLKAHAEKTGKSRR